MLPSRPCVLQTQEGELFEVFALVLLGLFFELLESIHGMDCAR